MFGCGVGVAVSSQGKLAEKQLVPDKGSSRHLLWTLMFLKVYGKECTMCKLAGVKDPKAFSHWVWLFIPTIAELEPSVVRYKNIFLSCIYFYFYLSFVITLQVIFDNRLTNDSDNDCLISVDETDFYITEHGAKFYSHKFKKSGFRYEVSSKKSK